MNLSDYILPRPVSNFHQEWDSIDPGNDAVEEFELSSSLPGILQTRPSGTDCNAEAVTSMVKLYGMTPADYSDRLSRIWCRSYSHLIPCRNRLWRRINTRPGALSLC